MKYVVDRNSSGYWCVWEKKEKDIFIMLVQVGSEATKGEDDLSLANKICNMLNEE